MSSMSYNLMLREHLAKYKQEVLGEAESGSWRDHGPYPHILPESKQALNIIPEVRAEFWDYIEECQATESRRVKLHRDFAHLNSSQALAFNLFFPFLGSSKRRADILLGAL